MVRFRVIPCLLLDGTQLVKSIRFNKHRYIGDPVNTIRIYNESEADELILLDINRSREMTEPNYDLIEKLVSECFMPLCYGGGVRSLDVAKKLFSIGVEKVAVNHLSFSAPGEIEKIVKLSGGQSVVLSVDITKNIFGKYRIYSHVDRKTKSFEILDFLKRYEDIGVGEILLNNVERDGKMLGYDLELLNLIRSEINVPLIALGGAGSVQDLKAVNKLSVSAAGASSIFIYQNHNRSVLISYLDEFEINEIHEDA